MLLFEDLSIMVNALAFFRKCILKLCWAFGIKTPHVLALIDRRNLSTSFLSGEGIEVGALSNPLYVRPGVKVRYVDRMTVAELRLQYPELKDSKLVEPDIIVEGELLKPIPDASQDFVIASHVIEHMEDPIGIMKDYLRVLRSGGVIFMAVPDKRDTFDRHRPVTSIEHLVEDHEKGSQISRLSHFTEWCELVYGKKGEELAASVKKTMEINYSIHFHVWESSGFLEFLGFIKRKYSLPFDITLFVGSVGEGIYIITKS